MCRLFIPVGGWPRCWRCTQANKKWSLTSQSKLSSYPMANWLLEQLLAYLPYVHQSVNQHRQTVGVWEVLADLQHQNFGVSQSKSARCGTLYHIWRGQLLLRCEFIWGEIKWLLNWMRKASVPEGKSTRLPPALRPQTKAEWKWIKGVGKTAGAAVESQQGEKWKLHVSLTIRESGNSIMCQHFTR